MIGMVLVWAAASKVMDGRAVHRTVRFAVERASLATLPSGTLGTGEVAAGGGAAKLQHGFAVSWLVRLLIVAELGLGVYLFCGRGVWPMALAAFLFALFTSFIGWLIVIGADVGCGCGGVEIPKEVALLRSTGLLLLCVAAAFIERGMFVSVGERSL